MLKGLPLPWRVSVSLQYRGQVGQTGSQQYPSQDGDGGHHDRRPGHEHQAAVQELELVVRLAPSEPCVLDEQADGPHD